MPAVSFAVSGTLANYAAAPSLTYSDDGGAAQSLQSATITSTAFNFAHPGITSGTHTLTISDGTTSATLSYTVAVAGWTSLAPTTSLSAVVTGLQATTPYDFQVFATNVVGQGPSSQIATFTITMIALTSLATAFWRGRRHAREADQIPVQPSLGMRAQWRADPRQPMANMP